MFSSIAVYKALYRSFGGFAADVVAAIDQVCKFAHSAFCNCFVCDIPLFVLLFRIFSALHIDPVVRLLNMCNYAYIYIFYFGIM